jgi:MATE family multidrug resistance protein
MSSFPKHSFEQAYDHAFPPSPPNGNNNTSATDSAVPSRTASPAQTYSNNNYNNSLAAPGPGLSTISERSPLITKAPIQNHPGSYTSINNSNSNGDDEDDYHPNNNHQSHGTSVTSTDTLLEQGNSSSSGQYMPIRDLTAREFKILLRYSAPVVLTYVLQNSLQLASLISLGHLGSIGKFACLTA